MPLQTVTISVRAQEQLSPVHAPSPKVIDFVGRKLDGQWGDLAVTTGANTQTRTYTFQTRDSSYEIAVGCKQGVSPNFVYSTQHFIKQTSSALTLSVQCGPIAVDPQPESNTFIYSPTMTGTLSPSMEYEFTTQSAASACPSPVRDEFCGSFADTPAVVFDTLYGTRENNRWLQAAIIRNVPAPSGPSFAHSLPLSSLGSMASGTLNLDLGTRTLASFGGATGPEVSLSLATANGKLLRNMQQQLVVTSPSTNSMSIAGDAFLAGAVATDEHIVTGSMQEQVSNDLVMLWDVEHTFRGTISNTVNNATLPGSFIWTLNAEQGSVGNVPRDNFDRSQVSLFNSSGQANWTWDADHAALTGAILTFAPQDLSGVTNFSTETHLPATADGKGYQYKGTRTTQDTVFTGFMSYE